MGTENNKLEYSRIDYTLLFLLFLLFIISLVAVYSASGQYFADDPYYFVKRQIIWYIIGVGIMFAVMFFDYELLENLALPFYFLGLILLVAVHFVGTVRNGSQRWINLGASYYSLRNS